MSANALAYSLCGSSRMTWPFGCSSQDRAQDHGHGTRLAGARGAQHREMLAEQAVGQDEGRHLAIVPQPADMHVRHAWPGIDLGEVAQRHGGDRSVERGIARHTPLEAGGRLRHRVRDLAQDLHLEHRTLGLVVAPLLLTLQAIDDAEHARIGTAHRDQRAHARRPRRGAVGIVEQGTPDHRAANRDHATDRHRDVLELVVGLVLLQLRRREAATRGRSGSRRVVRRAGLPRRPAGRICEAAWSWRRRQDRQARRRPTRPIRRAAGRRAIGVGAELLAQAIDGGTGAEAGRARGIRRVRARRVAPIGARGSPEIGGIVRIGQAPGAQGRQGVGIDRRVIG